MRGGESGWVLYAFLISEFRIPNSFNRLYLLTWNQAVNPISHDAIARL